ncbi:MAG: hypothetical protein JWP87_2932, partial [Labilithrix sp.]|nr:hypothetical protein [Labilithrix sp.]
KENRGGAERELERCPSFPCWTRVAVSLTKWEISVPTFQGDPPFHPRPTD